MIRLECQMGNSNKYYELDVEKENGKFVAKGYWGRMGNPPQVSYLYTGDSLTEAELAIQKKKNVELKKGYRLVGSSPTTVSGSVITYKRVNQGGAVPTKIVLTKIEQTIEQPIYWTMNALGVADESHLERLMKDENYLAQEKLDGVRAVIHVVKDGLRIFSRSAGVNDPTKPLEKTMALPHLAKLKFPKLVGTILDGEILGSSDKTSAEVAGDINRKGEGSDSSTLNVFDILAINGRDLREEVLNVRLSELDTVAPQLKKQGIQFPRYAHSRAEKESLHLEITLKNGEGMMFKNLEATYCSGGRPTDNWYKHKKSATFDCVIMGFAQGKGKYANSIGAVIFGQYVNGVLTELGKASGMDDKTRKDMSDHPDAWKGQAIEIEGMERLKSGAIRHPRYKGVTNKSPKDCIFYEGEQ